MSTDNELVSQVRAALENDPGINPHKHPIELVLRDDGYLILEGEVEDIIAKRRAVQSAATVSGTRGILDHLRLIPGGHRGDGNILDLVCEALGQEPVFHGCTIVARMTGPRREAEPPLDNPNGLIEVAVADGVVTLAGHVGSLTHKRLAQVLAWWVPGAVDVDDRLRVSPPEQDNDDEITDALRIVLEKDPWLDAGQISIHTRKREVILEGVVHSREQKHMAECDAWYLPGVHGVVNRLEVRP